MWNPFKRSTRRDRLRKEEQKAQKVQQKAEKKEMKRETRAKRKETLGAQMLNTLCTTSKQLVWLFSINGILWIWCSYVLAFLDKDQIAESLSSSVCTIVLGQIGMYLISKTIENVFKYNNFGGSPASNTVYREETVTSSTTTVSSSTANTPPPKEDIDYESGIEIPAVPSAGAVSADVIESIAGTVRSSESVDSDESEAESASGTNSIDPGSLS